MALSRLTQSKDQKIWWDLNPVYPKHKVYTKYLDKYLEKEKEGSFVGGYNYMTCSLFDNDALTEEQRNAFLSNYPDKESMEYQRYILGRRAAAEGLIFKQFALHKENWVINDLPSFLKGVNKQFISIGVDFGGSSSNTALVASLIYNNFSGIIVLKDDMIDMSGGDSTVDDFNKHLEKFIKDVQSLKIANILYIFGDAADTVMVNEIKQTVKKMGLYGNIKIMGSQKYTIKKRIDTKRSLLARNKWFVYKNALHVIDSTSTQVYDNREGHEDERLDNGSIDIDTADAEEYSWSAWLPKFIMNSNK
jgi:PBSX family phage terminase large subunit